MAALSRSPLSSWVVPTAFSLMLLVLLPATFWTALSACGWRVGAAGCLAPQSSSRGGAESTDAAEAAALGAQLAGLRSSLSEVAACPAPAPEPVRQTEIPPSISDRVFKERDVRLLRGCYALTSDYWFQSDRVRERVTRWTMCLDEGGNGRNELVTESGAVCSNIVQARISAEERVEFEETEDIRCNNGWIVFARVVRCEKSTNGVACEMTAPRSGWRGSVTLERKS